MRKAPRHGFGDDRQTCDLCHDWHEPARYDPVLGMTVCGKCREELESEPKPEAES